MASNRAKRVRKLMNMECNTCIYTENECAYRLDYDWWKELYYGLDENGEERRESCPYHISTYLKTLSIHRHTPKPPRNKQKQRVTIPDSPIFIT